MTPSTELQRLMREFHTQPDTPRLAFVPKPDDPSPALLAFAQGDDAGIDALVEQEDVECWSCGWPWPSGGMCPDCAYSAPEPPDTTPEEDLHPSRRDR